MARDGSSSLACTLLRSEPSTEAITIGLTDAEGSLCRVVRSAISCSYPSKSNWKVHAVKFSEILTEAREWLHREGRLTYRSLKLEFNLDDEQLAALTEELHFSHSEFTALEL